MKDDILDHEMDSCKGVIFLSWVQWEDAGYLSLHKTLDPFKALMFRVIWYAVEKKETPVGARSIQTHGISLFLLIIYVMNSTDITKISNMLVMMKVAHVILYYPLPANTQQSPEQS